MECVVESLFRGCTSLATVRWNIPSNVVAGTYKISHFGVSKNGSDMKGYEGESSEFKVES